jgi:hypothetical protein
MFDAQSVGKQTVRNREVGMASAATTSSFEKNPANIASIVAQELDSRSNSDRIPIVFLITRDVSEQESVKLLVARQGWRFQRVESAPR